MEKPIAAPENDIATEPYKGPGMIVTGVGEGAIAHYGTMLGGLIGGGALSGIFYKQVDWVEQRFRNFASDSAKDANIVKRWSANIAGWVQKTADTLASHMPKKLLEKVPQDRMRAVIFGGGILGFLGFFVAPVYFLFTGAKHANDGRQQFERAKDEILTTRAERDALRDKFVQSQVELETLKAGYRPADETPNMSSDTAPTSHTHPTSTAALSAVEADSPTHPTASTIASAPTTGHTLPGEGPRVQEPVLGPEHTEAWTQRLAERSAEALQHEAVR